MGAPLRLSPVELTACWDALGLELPPAELTGFGPGNGFDRPQRRAALAVLGERGLSDGARPCAALADMLHLLDRPAYRIGLRWGGRQDGVVEGVGAIVGTRSVTAVHSGGRFTLATMDSARIVDALLEVLGPIKPGTGRAVNISAEALDAAIAATPTASLWELADQLQLRGIDRLDASSLVHMCQLMDGRGQLGATGFVDGHAIRAPWVIGIHRTPSGWFVQIRRRGTATVCPVDAHQLRRHWRTLIEHCQSARSRYRDRHSPGVTAYC